MSFWKELKRRNVYKVGVAYAIVAWLIIQAVSITFPVLHLPGWAVTLVTVLVIIGFPFALLFAWAFEVTPEGIKRTKEVPLSESITHLTGKKLNYILAGVIVLAVAYILFDKFYLDRRAFEKEIATTDTEQAPAVSEAVKTKKTIAVLPFENLSSDSEQVYFVDGLSEEILNSLCQIPDLLVTGRTSSFSFKGSKKTVQEIADVLGVENILEGSVRKAGNILRITAQLLRAKDGFHLWSNSYDKELKDVSDILSIQEDIAIAVANELKITLGINKSFKQLGGTDNVEAYELYLIAKGQHFDPTAIPRALKSIDAAISMDPEFARAWALKAIIHILFTSFGPGNLADSHREDALDAAQKAVDLDPGLSAGYVSLGFTKMGKGEWIGSESVFRKALELSSETLSSDEMIYIADYYIGVGYFKKAVDLLSESRRNDPLNANLHAAYLEALALLGNHQKAQEEYENWMELFGDHWVVNAIYRITTIRPGIKIPFDIDEIDVSTVRNQITAIIVKNFESPKKGLMELRLLYQEENDLSSTELYAISNGAAYLGDPDFAMDAMEKGYDIDCGSLHMVWLPVNMGVRQTMRFKGFIREIGLVDYWNEFGWPDICRPLDNGDFECD